jgi:hypothetical protein
VNEAGARRLRVEPADVLRAAVIVLPLWASIVLVLASPAVAVIVVWVGKRSQDATLGQQREQLEQQRGQQRDQLKQEREQHEQMLRHQRQRDDLSEVRSVLDDAVRALNEADRCHRDLYDDLGNAEKVEALKLAGRKLDEVKQRLAIRFGSDHEVTTTFATCVELSLGVFAAKTHWRLEDHTYASETAKRAMYEFETARRTFTTAATRHAGVVLPDEPPSQQTPATAGANPTHNAN